MQNDRKKNVWVVRYIIKVNAKICRCTTEEQMTWHLNLCGQSCDITSGWNRSDMFHFSFSISRVVFRTKQLQLIFSALNLFMSYQCQCQFISYTCVWPPTPMYMNKSFSFDEALELSKACSLDQETSAIVFSSTQNVESAWNTSST